MVQYIQVDISGMKSMREGLKHIHVMACAAIHALVLCSPAQSEKRGHEHTN